MKKIIIVGAVTMLAAGAVFAQDWMWTGAVDQSDFDNGGNWTTNGIVAEAGPGNNATQFNIDSTGSYAIYNDPGVQKTVNAIYIGSSADGRLDVTAGTLQGSGQNGRYKWGNNGNTATVNISGTGAIDSGGGAHLGLSSNSDSMGILNISDTGLLNIGRGITIESKATSLVIGDYNASGSLTMEDSATLTLGFGIVLGSTANSGTGEFTVMGGDLDIRIGTRGGDTGDWRQSDGSTLRAMVGADGQLSTINLLDSSDAAELQDVTFGSGSILDLGFMGTEVDGEWTLMQFDDDAALVDSGLTLSAASAAAGWSFEFKDTDTSGGVDALVVSIPEPATVGLVAAFGGGILFIRRRFMI